MPADPKAAAATQTAARGALVGGEDPEQAKRAHAEAMCKKARKEALVLLVIAAVMGGLECWTITKEQRYSVKAVVVGMAALVLGLAGVLEPRILWAVGRQRQGAPPAFRAIGIALIVISIAAGFGLAYWLHG